MLTQEPIYKPSSIFYFKPILLSAHKLILLIYGDNTSLRQATKQIAGRGNARSVPSCQHMSQPKMTFSALPSGSAATACSAYA